MWDLGLCTRVQNLMQNEYPYELSETNSPPLTQGSWLYDEFLDDGLSLAASVAIKEQISEEIDSVEEEIDSVEEEMDATQVTPVLMIGNENPSESFMISTESELALSSFIAAELDSQPLITTPLEQPTLSIVGVVPSVRLPVVAVAVIPREQQDFCRVLLTMLVVNFLN